MTENPIPAAIGTSRTARGTVLAGSTVSSAMVETASGHRVLLAPSDDVATYVTSTYSFDEIRV